MEMSLIEIWVAPTDTAGAIPRSQLDLLDDSEIASWRRISSPEDRRRFLIGRITLRRALSSVLDDEPGSWRFVRGPDGKPALSPEHGVEKIDFNVSHSGNAVVVAVSTGGRIGVDIERVDESAACWSGGLNDGIFSERELTLIEGLSDSTPARARLKLWTVKEAYAKLLGVDPELEAFDVEISPSPWRILRAGPKARSIGPVLFETHDLSLGDESYHLAVARVSENEPRARASLRLVDTLVDSLA